MKKNLTLSLFDWSKKLFEYFFKYHQIKGRYLFNKIFFILSTFVRFWLFQFSLLLINYCLKGPYLGSDYFQVASFVIRRDHDNYCINMTNQSRDIKGKRSQTKLLLIKHIQTFRANIQEEQKYKFLNQ